MMCRSYTLYAQYLKKNTKRVIYVPLNWEILHLIETPASLATSQRVLSDRAVQSSRDRRLSCGCTTVGLYARPDAANLVVTIYRSVVKVVTVSRWLNFGHPAPPGRGLRRGENVWLRLTTASAQCLRLSEHFFHWLCYHGACAETATY